MRTLLLTAALLGCAFGHAPVLRAEDEPPKLPEPGVVVGGDVLEHGRFAWQVGLGVITDIRRADLDPRPGLEIVLTGTKGALVVDDETRRTVVQQVAFDSPLRRPYALDTDGDGSCEFLERQGGVDTDPKVAEELDLPEGPPVTAAWTLPFVVAPNTEPCLVVVVHYAGESSLGALLVYESDGKLVYHEVIESLGQGFATIPWMKESPGPELLLVPTGDDVRQYHAGKRFLAAERPSPVAEPEPPSVPRPTIHWEGPNALVVFDVETHAYFRTLDHDELAKTVKTQIASDARGRAFGLRITGLDEDSPLAGFGVERGDILTSIDRQPVRTRSEALEVLSSRDSYTDHLRLVVDRRGRLLRIAIDLRHPGAR